jgi:hypothetical protein
MPLAMINDEEGREKSENGEGDHLFQKWIHCLHRLTQLVLVSEPNCPETAVLMVWT